MQHIQYMHKLFQILMLTSLGLWVASCGQKGPLYLPEADASQGSIVQLSNRTTPTRLQIDHSATVIGEV